MVPDYPLLFWVCALAAMLIVGAGKAGFGGVVGAATPLLALTIPVTDAAALMLPLLIITYCFTVYHSGFTSTLLHAGGPPISIYLLPQKFPHRLYVGTTVIFFAAINLIKLIPYYILGLLKVGNLTTIIILAPMVYAGVRLGIFLNDRFSDLWFNRVIYTLLLLTGIKLIVGNSLF